MAPIFLAFAAALSAAAFQPAPGKDEPLEAAWLAGLEAEVAELRSTLPIRQGPSTITGVELRGAEIIYDFSVPDNVDEAFIARFNAALPAEACSDPRTIEHFRRGGRYTYRLRGPDGRVLTASIADC